MRVLVTGATGQVGRAVARHLLYRGEEVWALDRSQLDLTNPAQIEAVLDRFRPDWVVHPAAFTHVDGCEEDPERAYAVNAEGTRRLALACREVGARLLYVSTDYVFDGRKGALYVEDDPPNPLSVYARTKLLGEWATLDLVPGGMVVRVSWVFGGENNFPKRLLELARRHPKLRMVYDQVSIPTYTEDLAPALIKLMARGDGGIYHLPGTGACSRYTWARAILDAAGLEDYPLEPIPAAAFPRPARVPAFSAMANVRAAALGIVLPPWREGLRTYVRELLALQRKGASS